VYLKEITQIFKVGHFLVRIHTAGLKVTFTREATALILHRLDLSYRANPDLMLDIPEKTS